MSKQAQSEAPSVETILQDFRQSTIIIHATGSVRGVEEDVRAFQQSLDEAVAKINRLIEQAEKKSWAEGYHTGHEAALSNNLSKGDKK